MSCLNYQWMINQSHRTVSRTTRRQGLYCRPSTKELRHLRTDHCVYYTAGNRAFDVRLVHLRRSMVSRGRVTWGDHVRSRLLSVAFPTPSCLLLSSGQPSSHTLLPPTAAADRSICYFSQKNCQRTQSLQASKYLFAILSKSRDTL